MLSYGRRKSSQKYLSQSLRALQHSTWRPHYLRRHHTLLSNSFTSSSSSSFTSSSSSPCTSFVSSSSSLPLLVSTRNQSRGFATQTGVAAGNREDDRQNDKMLDGPAALDGPAWHPVLGDLQERTKSNANYRMFKGNQNELWSLYTEQFGSIFREVVWNDKVNHI